MKEFNLIINKEEVLGDLNFLCDLTKKNRRDVIESLICDCAKSCRSSEDYENAEGDYDDIDPYLEEF